MQNNINIEIAYATPDQQLICSFELPAECTIRQALLQSDMFPEIDQLKVGIFGKLRSLDFMLQNGDRIEIYRPLYKDPKDARAERVKKERSQKRVRK